MKEPKNYMKRTYRIIDSWQERLQAETLNHLGKRAFMFFDFKYTQIDKVKGDKVRDLEIGINTMTGEKNARVIFPLSFTTFNTFIDLIKRVAHSNFPMGGERQIHYKQPHWNNKTPSKELYTQVALVVGKDQDGIYLTMKVPNRQDIPLIYLRPSQNYPLCDETGKQVSNLESSSIHAIAWANSFDSVINYLFTHHYLDEEAYDQLKEQVKKENFKKFQDRQNGAATHKPQYGNSAPVQPQTYNSPASTPQPVQQQNDSTFMAASFDNDIPF